MIVIANTVIIQKRGRGINPSPRGDLGGCANWHWIVIIVSRPSSPSRGRSSISAIIPILLKKRLYVRGIIIKIIEDVRLLRVNVLTIISPN